MYEPKSIKVVRDAEQDESGRFRVSDGVVLLIYEIDGYEASILAHLEQNESEDRSGFIDNKVQSLFINTEIKPLGEDYPRMAQPYKKSPIMEGFERKYPDLIERLDKQKEYALIMKYVEEEIVEKRFSLLFDKAEESAKLAKEIEEYMFKERYGDIM